MDLTPIPLITFDEAKELDDFSVSACNIDPFSLMENASSSLWEKFYSHITSQKKIEFNFSSKLLFLVGSGNNGGDAFGMAINAYKAGYKNIVVVNGSQRGSLERNKMFLLLCKLPVLVIPVGEALQDQNKDKLKCDFLFDGICGIKVFDKPLRLEWSKLLKFVLSCLPTVVAIDTPSGLNELGANITLTVEQPKLEFYNMEKRHLCGKILQAKIPFPSEAHKNILYGRKNQISLLPKIDGELEPIKDPYFYKSHSYLFHKYKRGRVDLFVGSKSYGGAAVLSALSATSSGCGYVSVTSDLDIAKLVLQAQPGVVFTDRKRGAKKATLKKIKYAAVGSGWETKASYVKSLTAILKHSEGFLVIDASALTIISRHIKKFVKLLINYKGKILLTPHKGEFDKLYDAIYSGFKNAKNGVGLMPSSSDFCKKVLCLANFLNVEVLAKDAISYYAYKASSDFNLLVFDGLNGSLATAGSGDILAAFITGLVARIGSYKETSFYEAVSLALPLMEYSARCCYNQVGNFCASEIIPFLKKATATVLPITRCGESKIELK